MICLIEFQSSIDHFMSVRILTYVGLIYQDLIKQKRINTNEGLPPIFSMVFYTGEARWNAPLTLKQCLNQAIPPGLAHYQPNISYHVLDVGHVPIEECQTIEDNLVLSLIEIEQADKLSIAKQNSGRTNSCVIRRVTYTLVLENPILGGK